MCNLLYSHKRDANAERTTVLIRFVPVRCLGGAEWASFPAYLFISFRGEKCCQRLVCCFSITDNQSNEEPVFGPSCWRGPVSVPGERRLRRLWGPEQRVHRAACGPRASGCPPLLWSLSPGFQRDLSGCRSAAVANSDPSINIMMAANIKGREKEYSVVKTGIKADVEGFRCAQI